MYYTKKDFTDEQIQIMITNAKQIENYIYSNIIPKLYDEEIIEIKYGDYSPNCADFAKYEYRFIVGKNVPKYTYYTSSCSESKNFNEAQTFCGVHDNWKIRFMDDYLTLTETPIEDYDDSPRKSFYKCSNDVNRLYKLISSWSFIKSKIQNQISNRRSQEEKKNNDIVNFKI